MYVMLWIITTKIWTFISFKKSEISFKGSWNNLAWSKRRWSSPHNYRPNERIYPTFWTDSGCELKICFNLVSRTNLKKKNPIFPTKKSILSSWNSFSHVFISMLKSVQIAKETLYSYLNIQTTQPNIKYKRVNLKTIYGFTMHCPIHNGNLEKP